MSTKSFVPQFKAVDDDGTASWVMATLNAIDSDGDVTLPGAFGADQTFSIVPAHDVGHVPLGKGTLREEGNEAIVDAKFNLDIPAGRDWHAAIKFDLANPPAVQEYSYSYNLFEGGWRRGQFQGKSVRFFQPLGDGGPGLEVYESSPVIRGAGVNTRTLAAKSNLKFAEHIEAVLTDFDALVSRATDVMALRAEKGKAIGEVSADALERLAGSAKRLHDLLAAPDDTSDDEVEREFARFVAMTSGVPACQ